MAAVDNQSSRVFVSGLPPSLTSEQLASHFSKQYNVTDAHVLPDRRIGFVGFNDTQTAQNAVKHFNRSFIRMSRISVDVAKPVEARRSETGRGAPVSQRDADFSSRNKRPAERISQNAVRNRSASPTTNDLDSKKRKRDINDEGEGALSSPSHKTGLSAVDSKIEMPREDGTDVVRDVQGDGGSAPVASDSDWLRGRTSRLLDLVAPDEMNNSVPRIQQPTTDPEPQLAASSQSMSEQEDQLAQNIVVRTSVPNARLFLRNLAFDITEDHLRQKFGEFGKVQEVHVVVDTRKSISKGMAFVQFSDAGQAEAALQKMDGVAFHGRLLHILPASDKREQALTEFDISKMPLKKQKAVRRKLDAGTASFSWNSLYMNPDAVISSIAQRLGVSKSDILDPTSADAAIKQAHAETQIIAETKEYLRGHGVNTDALKNKSRDDRTILLKNFPFGTNEGDLRNMLEPFGQITRFLLPPAGTIAIVQFAESYFATQALRNLAYKNINGSVLYLEKAPQGLLNEHHATHETSRPDVRLNEATNESAKQQQQQSSSTTATVYIRNLNFTTTSSRLNDIFSPLSGFLSARVKTRTDPKRPGEILSMGYGFVEFRSKPDAEAAIAAMSGYRLDAHELIVKLSTKDTDVAEERRRTDTAAKSDANKTKILIKNLPFQASSKDVRSLFAPYGQLKSVRVPQKFDKTSRGFGFAEFLTTKEAESAMEALANTHLLGRRLVLDFAQEELIDPEEEIAALEKKMEQQSSRFNSSKLMSTGRKKFNVGLGDDDV